MKFREIFENFVVVLFCFIRLHKFYEFPWKQILQSVSATLPIFSKEVIWFFWKNSIKALRNNLATGIEEFGFLILWLIFVFYCCNMETKKIGTNQTKTAVSRGGPLCLTALVLAKLKNTF